MVKALDGWVAGSKDNAAFFPRSFILSGPIALRELKPLIKRGQKEKLQIAIMWRSYFKMPYDT